MKELTIFVTDYADGGVVIPLCMAVALTLLVLGRLRLTLVWCLVSASVWGTTLLLKLAGYTVATLMPALSQQIGLLTASGHVASAAAAYGGLICLLAASVGRSVLRAGLVGLGIASLIGVTRVVLGEHTVAEAIAGGAIGVCGAAGFAALARETLTGRAWGAVLGAAAGTLIVLHGEHFTLERTIAAASARAVQTFQARVR